MSLEPLPPPPGRRGPVGRLLARLERIAQRRIAAKVDGLATEVQQRLPRCICRQRGTPGAETRGPHHQQGCSMRREQRSVDDAEEPDEIAALIHQALRRGGPEEVARLIRRERLSDRHHVEQSIRDNWVRDRKGRDA